MSGPTHLIAPDEPAAYEIVNPHGRSRAILTCDHASKRVPRRLSSLGLEREDLERHIAWDIGAQAVARRLAERLDAALVVAGYSRLVADCNRPLSVADAFITRSEATGIPGNYNLSEDEKNARAEAFFWPYHDAVHRVVDSRLENAVPVLISVHSFTPVYHGERRPWDIGVHYRLDKRFATLALDHLRADGALVVGDNEPYPVALDLDYTVLIHAERRGIPYVLLEIRQDHIGSDAGVEAWAARLSSFLSNALAHPNLDHFGERATDVDEPRYARGELDDAEE